MSAPTIEIAQRTDVGPVRSHNEDAVLATWVTSDDDGHEVVLAVADGVGGHAQGEVASAIAVDTVVERLIGSRQDWIDGAAVEQTIRLANSRINALAQGEYAAPATTMTVCWATDREYVVGHVGDSRAYLLSKTVVQLTDDDSHVAEAVRRGLMTPEDARRSPLRNQLTKSVGTQEDVQPELHDGSWAHGDVLLLCSDGLSEYLDGEEMLGIVRETGDLQDACDRMVQLAAQRGGHDNISVVAARNLARSDDARPPTRPFAIPPAKPKSGGGFMRWIAATAIVLALGLIGYGIIQARQPKATPLATQPPPEIPAKPHLFLKLLPGQILRINASKGFDARIPNLDFRPAHPLDIPLKPVTNVKPPKLDETTIRLLDRQGNVIAEGDTSLSIQVDVDPDVLMSVELTDADGKRVWQSIELEILKQKVEP